MSMAGKLADLDDRLSERVEIDKLIEDRLRGVEDRLERIEPLAGRVPAIEARISRVETIMLEMQGEMRRATKVAEESRRRAEEKLDKILEVLHRDG